ncbi:MAG: aldo/keto reductase [Salinivirgaceae bacterium]|nr:aldo/keto reductase [Salinivirgaceae bacterium]
MSKIGNNNLSQLKCVVGTNSWGGSLYGKLLRGESVDESVIKEAFDSARAKGLAVFDLAQDYGFGQAQKMIGRFGCDDVIISSKFTPTARYKARQVKKSFEKDLADFGRSYVDIYWLHLPNDICENLSEIIDLYHDGKIRHIGVSNFTLDECRLAKSILDASGIPFYGVQNHYSLLCRDWERNGLVEWCRENGISFWAWAVLEEGMLTNPKSKSKKSVMKLIFNRKKKKLKPLYELMESIGNQHYISIPQVAMSFCSSKGIVPICGCRKAYQVEQLYNAVNVKLSDAEIKMLEAEADRLNVTILGADVFRFAVRKR